MIVVKILGVILALIVGLVVLVHGYILIRYGTLDACEAAIANIHEQVSLKPDAEVHIERLRARGAPACYGVAVRGARAYGLLKGYE